MWFSGMPQPPDFRKQAEELQQLNLNEHYGNLIAIVCWFFVLDFTGYDLKPVVAEEDQNSLGKGPSRVPSAVC